MSNIRSVLMQAKSYYHNSQQWWEDSWVNGKKINELIDDEITKDELEIASLKKDLRWAINSLEVASEFMASNDDLDEEDDEEMKEFISKCITQYGLVKND